MIFEKDDFNSLDEVFKACRMYVAADEDKLLQAIEFRRILIDKMIEANKIESQSDKADS